MINNSIITVEQKLQKAIIDLDIEKVKNCLEKGADPNKDFQYKKVICSSLALAIQKLHSNNCKNQKKVEDIVSELLKHNANPNSTYPMNTELFKTLGNCYQPSVLEECILRGNYKLVGELLYYGAKPQNHYAYDNIVYAISLDINKKEYFHILLELLGYGVKFSVFISKIFVTSNQRIINNFNIYHIHSLEKCFKNKKLLSEYLDRSIKIFKRQEMKNNVSKKSTLLLDNYFSGYINLMNKYKKLMIFIKNIILISSRPKLNYEPITDLDRISKKSDYIDILNSYLHKKSMSSISVSELMLVMQSIIQSSRSNVIAFSRESVLETNKNSIQKNILVKFINLYCNNVQKSYEDEIFKYA